VTRTSGRLNRFLRRMAPGKLHSQPVLRAAWKAQSRGEVKLAEAKGRALTGVFIEVAPERRSQIFHSHFKMAKITRSRSLGLSAPSGSSRAGLPCLQALTPL
jgi:2-oxo-4-hydroxy-4-carboxy--5-ureidoimidazoline (OHCU) decarboxylase